MEKNKKNVPKIRFKGYSEEWKEKQFIDNIISIKTGTNLLGSITNIGVPLLKMGNIQRGFFSLEKVEFLDKNVNVEKENIVYYGDFLFNTRNTLELVGKGATWMGDSNVYAFNSNIARFVFKGIDTIFFNYLYNTKDIISQVQARAMGTTSVAAIYPKNLNSIKYQLPSLGEQKLIGNYFQNIDKLIEANQSKLNKLKNIKKACLEKLFPKKGATVPEIRFKGFIGEWGKKELGELSEPLKYGLNAASTKYDEINKYIRITDIDDETNVFNYKDLTSPNTDPALASGYLLRENDILFARTGASVGKTYLYRKTDGIVYYAGFLIRARIKIDFNSEFIFQNTLTTQYHNFVKITSQRSGQPGINAQEYSLWNFTIPKEENEQNKIGSFFKNLDNLIIKNEHQLTKLKNIKKACLEKMFVNKEDAL